VPVAYESREPQTPAAIWDSFTLKQGKFISINGINQLIYLMEKKFVPCVAVSEFLSII
jgi:hypothetical protein